MIADISVLRDLTYKRDISHSSLCGVNNLASFAWFFNQRILHGSVSSRGWKHARLENEPNA